ncbi:AraC family transcriptional regulator ligand-binding domain-containing protein [uncultured Paludibaculum sp.]|uniref:AraC family transcriptional regulator n=1 Tax=uncultured Paludibaculum sp. TaxID=1765020 RepID=UPI002AAC1843|nr:AraC family transcriptional regulator ligand-binding domain-containing protein [uncultured Paludibaculum sp.]
MTRRFRVNTLLSGKLEELGVPPADVLRHAGLPAGLLDLPKPAVTTEELFALWRAVGEVSRDPAIGLKLGSEDRIERYDPIAIAALYTPSFAEALQRMARYKQLTCPEELRIVNGPRETSVEFLWLLATMTEPPTLIDLCFAWVVNIARRGTGVPLTPARIQLTRRRDPLPLLEQHFGCPVDYEGASNAIFFHNQDLERPFLTHNAELLSMIAPQLDQELNQREAEQSLPDRIRLILKRQLAGQRPTVQLLARELHMSVRSLQRRLTAEGSSFQQILEEARREMARHYLVHSSLELNETAYLLGYEDANSFVRAFRVWEGIPPAHWRELQRV